MRSGLLSLLPSVLVLLHCTRAVLSVPVAIPRPPPGSKVVIVVGGGKDGATHPNGLSQSLVLGEGKSLIFPAADSSHGQIKRQGHPSKMVPPEGGKKEKPRLAKVLPLSARHVSDIVPEPLYQPRKSFDKGKILPNEKRIGPGPHLMDFRPHQPDITSDMQHNNGKLSLPVMGFTDGTNGLGAGLRIPRPTPMANKLNPYTNGVAASFPPGIDPYDGFMRYAAENLETPMPNFVDYQSLEHLYGSQHPLSPYHGKEPGGGGVGGGVQSPPYADTFGYSNGIESSNSPPSAHLGADGLPPGFGEGPGGPNINEGGGGGFRAGNNALGGRPGGSRDSNPNTIATTAYEHGIDHFHAPSPGLSSAPPRPRPQTSDPGLYEEEHGHRSPPFESPEGPPPFAPNHHSAPFKHPTSAGGENSHSSPLHDDGDRPHSESPHVPEPADLDVYEEGPPPPGSHPPLGPPPENSQNPSSPADQGLDGGDDAIWGILDLAEMLEKAAIAGGQKDGNSQASPQGGSSNPRLVVPVFTRPPPPRSYGGGGHHGPEDEGSPGGGPDAAPPHLPPHHPPPPPSSNSGKGGFPGRGHGSSAPHDGGFDYDDHSEGGHGRPSSSSSGSFDTPLDSQEGSDYGDDLYKK